jgi:peptidoglycan/LPS O-acetylase OafA/YrhL
MPGIALQRGDDRLSLTSFRNDIQGLRAIAVLAVVLYHAGLSVPGGFVGVDMFFVISGFVISRLIMNEYLSSVGFSIRRFFVRRIKRLLPILFVVVLTTTLLLTTYFSSFGEVQQASISAQWASGFAANIGLLLDDTYIGLVDNPFRHLWSLAVEEQFYLVFPFLFIAYLRADRSSISASGWARRTFALLTIFSLGLCVAFSLSTSDMLQKVSFFSMPTRMWQFFAGVGVMLVERHVRITRTWRTTMVSISSVVGVGWSLWTLREWSSFPGFWAIVPTIATAGLIMTSLEGTKLNAVLSWKPLTLIGDVSYGWYLWHWPVVVVVHRQFGNGLAPSLVAITGSLSLSFVTYFLLENPIRRRSIGGRTAVVIALTTSLSMLVLASVVKNSANETQARALDPEVGSRTVQVVNGLAPRDTLLTSRKACNEADRTADEIVQLCSNNVSEGRPSVLLLGDSHAGAISDGLFAAGEKVGVRVTGFFGYGCPIASGFGVSTKEICESSVRFSMALASELKPDMIIIANSYVTYLTGEQPADLVVGDSQDVAIPANLIENSVVLINALESKVRELLVGTSKVVILHEVPFAIMPGTKTVSEMWAHNKIQDLVSAEIESRFADGDGVAVVDVATTLCGSSPTCAIDNDGVLQYWHKTHLNRHGSLRLTLFWVEKLTEGLGR